MPTENNLSELIIKSKAYEMLRKIHTIVERAVYWKR